MERSYQPHTTVSGVQRTAWRACSFRSTLLELGADPLPSDEFFTGCGPLNPPAPDATFLVHADGVVAPAVERDLDKLRLCHGSSPPHALALSTSPPPAHAHPRSAGRSRLVPSRSRRGRGPSSRLPSRTAVRRLANSLGSSASRSPRWSSTAARPPREEPSSWVESYS